MVRRLLVKYRRLLPESPRVLDIGCGGGATLVMLSQAGRAIGLDRAEEALRLSRSRGRFPLVCGTAERLPFADDSFDAVTALDVLEHIPDERAAVAEIARVCARGGLVIITVPAYQSLWSEHDEALDHIRRYRAGAVRKLLRDADLGTLRLSYCITALLPPIFAFRRAQRLLGRADGTRPKTALRPLREWPNRLLIGLLALETSWLLRLPLPFGVSVVAVARKPSSA